MATNIYIRGTTQWWRRSVCFAVIVNDPITIRMSLKTRCPREARARAGYLEMEMQTVETTIAEDLRTRIVPDDLRAIYRAAFEACLDRYIVQQAATPFRAEAHAAANLAYARFFTLMATTPELPHANEELRERLAASGLTQQDADALFMTVGQHRGASPIGHNHLAGYLRSAGVKPTEGNMRAASRVAAAAYRNACLAATEGLGLPNPESDVWPLPGALSHLLGLSTHETMPVVPMTPMAQPVAGTPPKQPVPVQTPDRSDGKLDGTLSELAAICLERKIDDREWRDERRRDIDAVVNLFLAANGDLLLSDIDQRACSAMTALFSRLPTRYGHMREDIEGGMAAILERGDALREIWKRDPVNAENDLLPTVGISDITHNKHLTWLSALFKFADANGYVTPKVDLGKLRRKVKARKGGKRLPWAEKDLRKLVTGPVWTGCKGLWERLMPGDAVFHDGIYWGLPLVVCTGGRSEEPAGLTGAGEKAFCAGADLRSGMSKDKPVVPATGFAGLIARFDRRKPIIAAVNGFAMGGGFEAALACDIIIAAEHAKFGLTEPRVGLAALGGGTQRLIAEIGRKRADSLLLTGRKMTASEAASMGLVAEIVPAADLLAAARRWADEIMLCSPASIAATKAVARSMEGSSMEESIKIMLDLPEVRSLLTGPDAREGIQAFAEKRKPNWSPLA